MKKVRKIFAGYRKLSYLCTWKKGCGCLPDSRGIKTVSAGSNYLSPPALFDLFLIMKNAIDYGKL